MRILFSWCYTIGIYLYTVGIHIAALFNAKAKLWVHGRKGIFEALHQKMPNPPTDLIWVHCASLGEFEQGRPIMEAIKKRNSAQKILLTFFSPSGYEVRKNYAHADFIFYLPADTPSNVKRFLAIVQPSIAIFVKYEFWYNYLTALQSSSTQTYCISALFRPNQIFFRKYGQPYQQILKGFNHIFVQNNKSKKLLQSINIQLVTVAGDTRIDRVIDLSQTVKTFPIVAAFTKGIQPVLIAGSTWQPDEQLLIEWSKTATFNHKLIIAPHEIHASKIDQLIKDLPVKAIRYTEATLQTAAAATVLIINNIGILSALYRYGSIAYIGGAFDTGLHNTLEPIVYGLPVITGPKYHKFEEAVSLIEHGGGFPIQNLSEFEKVIQQLDDTVFYNCASQIAKNYIEENKGATQLIIEAIF